ncbi:MULTISPECIES: TonB-dependent receptor [unclassified Pseudoalteromonas]|uniref:TonB-dependent receptor n=1 Tax=unclassified Pseudoalteromonas TaxID=194690 RepID=UPI0009E3F733|nr:MULTISPECIES: TonB-dependent receptor [unclassified Pseudoalteromonas]
MKTSYLTQAIRTGLLLTSTFALSAFAQEDISGVEKIVVTGQKIDRSLQETAASVAVFTEKNLEQQNITNFGEILAHAPNVNFDDYSFSIRGIDAFNVSGGGNSYLASVYVDGAALPYRMIQSGGFSTWDVSQVEILRGPQSTLQGRNALAGAVVMSTKDPSYESDMKVRIGFGDYGRKDAAIALGGELVDNQVTFRFSGEKSERDGFVKNITRNDRSDYSEDQTYRLKVRVEPEAIPDLSVMFSYTYNEQEDGVSGSATSSGLKKHSLYDTKTFDVTENDLYSIKADYDINDIWSLTSISNYVVSDYNYQWDGDAGVGESQSVLTDDRTDTTFSQEFRATFEYEQLSGLIGLYHSSLDVDDINGGDRKITLARLGVPTLLVASPEYGGLGLPQNYADMILGLYQGVDPVELKTHGETSQKVVSSAIFADLTYEINEQWDILAGIRWDRETQENEAQSVITVANGELLPDPSNANLDPMTAQIIAGLNAQLYKMADDASGNEPLVDASFNAFLPKLGVSYHFTEDMTTSFIYQKGYRSGGVGTNIAQATIFTYDAEYTNNYELSYRSVWLDGALVANANLFYVDWKDQQVQVQLGANQYDRETRNAGSSFVKGFETEIFYHLNSNLTISAGLGLSDTEFEDFPLNKDDDEFNLAGFSFRNSPEWTGNIAVTYKGDNGFFANINANYVDESRGVSNPYAQNNDPKDIQEARPDFDPMNDSVALVNTRIGYEWDNMGAYLTVSNLFDKDYITLVDTGYGTQTYGAPREVAFRFHAKF